MHKMIQTIILLLIQVLSLIVIILNAVGLSKANKQGLIRVERGPEDSIMLIMAVISLVSISLFLFCLVRSIELSRKLLVTQIGFAVLVIALWTSAASITLTEFHASSSNRDQKSIKDLYRFISAMIIVGFITIGLWFLLLLTTLYTFADQCKVSFIRPPSPVYPYENVKIQISPNHDPVTQHDDMQYDTVTIAEDEEDFETTAVDHKDTILTEPLPVFTSSSTTANLKDWQFDFEPIDVDFMLQETSSPS